MPSSSRIVFAEDLGRAALWMPGPLPGVARNRREHESSDSDPETPPPPSYEDGLRDGYARAREEMEAEQAACRRRLREEAAERIDALMAQTTTSLREVQESLAGELRQLGIEIARSVLGASIRTRDDAIESAVQSALQAIVGDHARASMRLHPDDLAWVGEQLGPLLESRGITLASDPEVHPGGCLIETARGLVDASVQSRWRRALAELGQDDDWLLP